MVYFQFSHMQFACLIVLQVQVGKYKCLTATFHVNMFKKKQSVLAL